MFSVRPELDMWKSSCNFASRRTNRYMTMNLPVDFVTQSHALLVDAPAFLDALQGEPVVSIRLNRRKVPDMPLPGEPVPWCLSGRASKHKV